MERFQEDPEELRLSDLKLYRRCLATRVNSEFSSLVLLYLTDLGSAWLRRYWTKAQMIELSYGCMALKATKERPPGPRRRSKKAGSIPAEEKEKNIKYQYAEHLGHCVFDIPRQVEDNLQYTVLEEIKDRLIRSSKYEPIDFNCSDSVHVVVCSNFLPSLELEHNNRGEIIKKPLLSRDRVFIINIDESVCGHPDDLKSFDMYLE